MKQLIILAISILIIPVNAQETLHKLIDIDSNASRNYIRDMILVDGNPIIQSLQFCNQDTTTFTCGSITILNQKGEIVNSEYNFTTEAFNDGPNCLNYNNDKILYSTNLTNSNYQYTNLISYNRDLIEQNNLAYNGPVSGSNIGNQGVELIDKNMFIYGNVNNVANLPDSIEIIKTNELGAEKDRYYFSYGSSRLSINDLQETPDSNLAFILKIQSAAGSNNGFDGYQLMKIDTAGNLIDTFAFEDSVKQPNRLLVTSDNGYVFSSTYHPVTGSNIFTTGYGLINKLNANMDTLDWSVVLPNNQSVDGRHYNIWDYIEAKNGDIVACGMAFDNTDTELATGVPDKNSTWNGFIVRISPEGIIKWLRLYKTNNDLLPHQEYGHFRPSRLNKIKELSDGRLIASGDVFVKNNQLAAINELETEAFHLLLLIVDNHGCLDDYDCEEIIRISNNSEATATIDNYEWIYEEIDYVGGGNSSVGFKKTNLDAFVYQDGKVVLGDTISPMAYIEDRKMHFWDEHYEEYIMYYNFEATESYEIKYYNPFSQSDETATVVIDSISHQYFGDDSLRVQHIHVLNSGTLEEYSDVIYEGIGAGYYGMKLLLGCGLCDDNPYTTKIRCFSNEAQSYQFVPYACDSTWLSTSIDEVNEVALKIYPNPTSELIYIDGINKDTEYLLYSVDGQLIKQGKSINNSIAIDHKGYYTLKLRVAEKWINRKVVRID